MKCNCGYAYYFEGSEDNRLVDGIAEEDFIRVNVVATVRRGFEPELIVALYACPVCHTVQVDF